ncbi:pantoate--beta-alanine ligase [Paenactinomyces guangxiensis]|uniref:Pantothenate synthetase n=1 Tax=Paenactinomyces guangxiensis TaxID=1490290 RepID=A0A7W2A7F3_9BACL|nr:pantoate--beta-alanine ligase [Paenactinomyces guangxiensis]MBA4494491.1 pantoate--beta-alanine ligase [Paenactinomyces guangxiensis]MBH8591454.1 pantoate--beta-alanine ligase [Paenactinomyces guangxiensis]
MKIIETVSEMRSALNTARTKTIGFVPTMGYLHEGHLSLMKRARQECDIVVISIFVNPLQFGPGEDLDRYPRDLQRDASLARDVGVDFLFHPSVDEMYPEKPLTQVKVSKITELLCGKARPGHFEGVATVVTKLFHIIMPNRAYFGLKDAQQLAVIEQMVRDLHFPVTVVPCETMRESDGLAMSSRNVYLSDEERRQAVILNQALREVKIKLQQGQFTTAAEVNQYVRDRIGSQPLARIEYVETLAYPTLDPLHTLTHEKIIIAVAVRFGSTRLIDNLLFEGRGES